MIERFLAKTNFASQEDFIKNLKINVPENFNFGYDVVDAWAAEQPDKKALLWTNDKGESRQFSFADMKRYTDMTASYFQSLGIGRGDMVMLILKRRYEFWYSIIALHKLGATVIPATHLLTKKDIVYRCNAADIKMIVAAGEADTTAIRYGQACAVIAPAATMLHETMRVKKQYIEVTPGFGMDKSRVTADIRVHVVPLRIVIIALAALMGFIQWTNTAQTPEKG